MPRHAGWKRLALAVFVPVLLLLCLEGVARLLTFDDGARPLDVVMVRDQKVRRFSVNDPDVFYTLRKNATFDFDTCAITTNRFGTRDPAPPEAKEPNALRVVCLGDSTAFGNFSTYPRLLQRLLAEAYPDRKVEVMNAGIPGASSFQGVKMFERDLAALKPDFVTFCYGFNDSKVEADFLTDRERAAQMQRPLARVARVIAESRLVSMLASRLRPDSGLPPEPPGHNAIYRDRPWRVPAADHARNVEELQHACAAVGARLIVMTQPHAFRPEWKPDLSPGPRSAMADIIGRFEALYAAEREACRTSGATCFDLAAAFARHDPDLLFLDAFPGKDSIHANPIGLSLVAEELFAFLLEQHLLPPPTKAPDLPRFTTIAPAWAAAACDVDGDGLDALLLATVIDGQPVALKFDARTEACARIPIDLPVPNGRASLLARPPAKNLRGAVDELMLVGITKPGLLSWASASLASGRRVAGSVPAGSIEVPTLVEEVRGLPTDLDGDGDFDSLLASMGPTGPALVSLFGADLSLIATFNLMAMSAPHLDICAAQFITRRPIDMLAFTEEVRKADGFLLSRRAYSGVTGALGLGIQWAPTRVVAGHFTRAGGLDEIAIMRGPGFVLWDQARRFSEMYLPVRSLRMQFSVPQLGIVKIPGRAKDRVLISSHHDGRIHAVEFTGDGFRPVLDVAFP